MPELPITLYIPCYNAAPFLDRVLPAALSQTLRPAAVLVVDDGSTDGTAAIAERHGVAVIRHERNRGLGAARNTAVRAAETGFVACLDADVVAQSDWLEQLAANFADDRYVAASGQLHESVFDSVADRWRDAHMRQSWGPNRIENPDFLYGNNGLFRRDALLEAGLYDESCRTNGEDVKMTRALKRMGARLVYDPKAHCLHLRADDVESICRTYWNWKFIEKGPMDAAGYRKNLRISRKILAKHFARDLLRGDLALARLALHMYSDWRRRHRDRYERDRARAGEREPRRRDRAGRSG